MAKKNRIEKTISKLLDDRDARIDAAGKSHYLFFHIYFSRYVTYETADFQREMFALTEDEKNPLCVIVAFRESGKSSIITTSYPLWAILGKQQKKFVLILCQTQPKAQQALRNIRWELENNDILREDMGPFQEESGPWGAQGLVFRNSGAKISIGSLEQSIRGIRHREFRPDLIILDDIEDTASVKTQTGRDKTWEWFTSEVIPAGNKARIFAVGNLLHHDSLLKRIEAQIKSHQTPGAYKEYPIIQNGVSLWPGKFPTLDDIEVERRRIMDRIAWHREYLLEILPDDDQLIRSEWIQRYDSLPPEKPRFTVIGIDPAISKENTADYTAMVAVHVYGHREKMKIYVSPHIVNKRLTFNETILEAEALSRTVGMGSRAPMVVEKVAYQQALIEQLKLNGNPVEGISPGGTDKHARLASVTHYYETAKIFFPKGPLADTLINQHLGFGTEKFDDTVDALTLTLHEVMRKDRYGGGGSGYSGPPNEDDLRNLDSRAKFVIMEKWHNYRRPDAI